MISKTISLSNSSLSSFSLSPRVFTFCFTKDGQVTTEYKCNKYFASILLRTNNLPENNKFTFPFEENPVIFPKILSYASGNKMHILPHEISIFYQIVRSLNNDILENNVYSSKPNTKNIINSLLFVIKNNLLTQVPYNQTFDDNLSFAAQHISELHEEIIDFLPMHIVENILSSPNINVENEVEFFEIIESFIKKKGNEALKFIQYVNPNKIPAFSAYRDLYFKYLIEYLQYKQDTENNENTDQKPQPQIPAVEKSEKQNTKEEKAISEKQNKQNCKPVQNCLFRYFEAPYTIRYKRKYTSSNAAIEKPADYYNDIFEAIDASSLDSIVYTFNNSTNPKLLLSQIKTHNDNYSYTPFAYAMMKGNIEISNFLMQIDSSHWPEKYLDEAILGLAKGAHSIDDNSYKQLLTMIHTANESSLLYQDSNGRNFISYLVSNRNIKIQKLQEFKNTLKNDNLFSHLVTQVDNAKYDSLYYLIKSQSTAQALFSFLLKSFTQRNVSVNNTHLEAANQTQRNYLKQKKINT